MEREIFPDDQMNNLDDILIKKDQEIQKLKSVNKVQLDEFQKQLVQKEEEV